MLNSCEKSSINQKVRSRSTIFKFSRVLIYLVLILTLTLSVYSQSEMSLSAVKCNRTDNIQEFCKNIVEPVCGYYDTNQVKCKTASCATTFNNSCFACKDKTILYYAKGKCSSIVVDPIPPIPAQTKPKPEEDLPLKMINILSTVFYPKILSKYYQNIIKILSKYYQNNFKLLST